jgi:uncharacterized protein (DUF433 family)
MSTVQKSMRIPKELIKELKAITQESGKDFSTVTKELLQEAIKMRRCPGIVFTVGVSGYRARIAGTGIEVWEVIASYKSIDKDLKRLRKTYRWLTEQQLKAAIGYWKTYPDEIDHLITQNESWTKERIHERYPFLEKIGS